MENSEPIAILGAGCRFPGGADSPDKFWQLLQDGVDAVVRVPAHRASLDPDHLVSPFGGFLESVDGFDPHFFGISPREAGRMDPQQRLFLEVAWEALERAGVPAEGLAGSATGVYAGVYNDDYTWLQIAHPEELDAHTYTGSYQSVLAGRLSYLLDLRGPSLAVDTACSSSLVAVHLACRALRSGEIDLAIAGGVNLIVSPLSNRLTFSVLALSATSRCQAFDARADGFVRGEGCGVIVLKRLSEALADGDPVLAVIRGSAVNQDGRSAGLTAPNPDAQEALVRRALADADVDPAEPACIETHGTGTPVGDPIEAEALARVLGRSGDRPCALSSVKTNIGHLEAAAGIAGLIKMILALRHETIPRNLHFRSLNPKVPIAGTRLYVPAEARPWPRGAERRYAGISSFGVGGTNAHVILEEAPEVPEPAGEIDPGPWLFTLSARTPEALDATAAAWAEAGAVPGDAPRGVSTVGATPSMVQEDLADVAWTAAARRTHHKHRLACVSGSREELAAALAAYRGGEPSPGLTVGRVEPGSVPRKVFVFSGHGSQWTGMGRELLARETVVREVLTACDRALREAAGWSLLDALTEGAPDTVDYVQPMLFSMQMALAALWRSWGVEPDAVVGHSLGEVAAACVAGALTLEEGAWITAHRSRLLRRLSGLGALALADMTPEEAEALLAPYADRLVVGAVNGPRSVLLAGEAAALDEVLAELERRAVFHRRVKADVPSHCPQVEPLCAELRQVVAGKIHPTAAQVPFYSTVTGGPLPGEALDAEQWVRNLRQPVLFFPALERLAEDGCDLFLEVSPHPVLSVPVQESLRHLGRRGTVLPSLRRNEGERATLLASLGALHTLGQPVDWERVHGGRRRVADLPTYPWERQSCWFRGEETERAAPPPPARLLPVASSEVDSIAGEAVGSAAEFYDALSTLLARDRTLAPEGWERGYLTFGILPDDARDFAWPLAFFFPERHPEQHRLLVEAQQELRDTLFRGVDLGRVRKVADLGCGYAADLIALARRHPHLELDGYNVSGGQLAVCRERLRALGLEERVRVHHRDSGRDELPGGRDLVLGFEVTGLVEDKDALFANVARSLEEGGILLLADFVTDLASPLAVRETSTFSITRTELAEVLGRHRLRIAGCVDVSGEVARFLHDPQSAAHVGQVLDELRPDDVARRHLGSWDNIGKALGQKWLSYLLLHVEKSGRALPAEVARANRRALAEPTAYREIAAGAERAGVYRVAWEERAAVGGVGVHRTDQTDRTDRSDSWLLLGDHGGVAEALAARLTARGERCRIAVSWSEALAAESWRGVVHLGGLVGALGLVQGLARAGKAPRLWLVTRGTQAAVEGEAVDPGQAALWGFGRTVAHEHPELRCTLIDLAAGEEGLDQLAAELTADGDERQVALRPGRRSVARLVRARTGAGVAPAPRAEATYLITGGLGALGLEVAQWLAARGARHLALLGRSAPSSAAATVIEELRRGGVRVVTVAADVAVREELERALAEIEREGPPVGGVVHAAGILDDGILLQLDAARLEAVLAPKVAGAWNLHELTLGRDLDLFLLFSSFTGVLGSPGQAGYAAGNAFLDALAHHRRSLGLPALAVDWAPWSDAGLATRAGRGDRLAARGLGSLSTAAALAALERLLAAGLPQAAVLPLDVEAWGRSHPAAAADPFYERLRRAAPAPVAAPVRRETAGDALDRSRLLATALSDRSGLLQEYLRRQVARVLRLPLARVDVAEPLVRLGLDSLMGVELRNRLDVDLQVAVPVGNFLRGDSISLLSRQVLEQLAVALPPSNGGWEQGEI
jgi:acyl transferase domain-containing protein/SAM-dependent methyltransferase